LRLSATVGVAGHDWLIFVQRFVQRERRILKQTGRGLATRRPLVERNLPPDGLDEGDGTASLLRAGSVSLFAQKSLA
jgi:hypothetical protein